MAAGNATRQAPRSAMMVTVQETAGPREILLKTGDFSLLRGIAGGKMVIGGSFQKEYLRFQKLGLVKHRFDYSNDWPVTFAVLTSLGIMVLDEDPTQGRT